MSDYCKTIDINVTVQENGLIRHSDGHLIAKLFEESFEDVASRQDALAKSQISPTKELQQERQKVVELEEQLKRNAINQLRTDDELEKEQQKNSELQRTLRGMKESVDKWGKVASKNLKDNIRLREAINKALDELGVPQPEYPAPITNAHKYLTEALANTDIQDEPVINTE